MDLHLRYGSPGDAGSILLVHRAAVRGTAAAAYDASVLEAWAPLPITLEQVAALSARIAEQLELVVVAQCADDEIVGFGSITPPTNELRAVYVSPDHGRMGFGGLIIERLLEKARELGLTHLAMDASLNAVAFYAKHGFRIEGQGQHTLRSGQSMACVKMRRDLDAARVEQSPHHP